MMEQNFGHKELSSVVLRAKAPMQFGDRYIEAEEPVLYFDNIQLAQISEQTRPVFARGGFGNMPRVVWNDRSEVQFQMVEGVMSSVGMSILLSSNVMTREENKPLYIHKIEGPLEPTHVLGQDEYTYVDIQQEPVPYNIKKTFIFYYDRNSIQEKIYGSRMGWQGQDEYEDMCYRLKLWKDKKCETPAESGREYVIDYYYQYEDEAQIYSVKQERFNGLFTLEAKFYSKDENEGKNYTNLLYMPKVRIVSSINLRLGERADPTVSTFNIIGLPETVGDQKNLIMEITRLGELDLDANM